MNPFNVFHPDFSDGHQEFRALSLAALRELQKPDETGEGLLMSRFLRDNRELMTQLQDCTETVVSVDSPSDKPGEHRALKRLESQDTLRSDPSFAGSSQCSHSLSDSVLASALCKSRSRPLHYNILLLGESSSGKTSFLQSFFASKLNPLTGMQASDYREKTQTTEIEHHLAVYSNGDLDLRFDVIDTPGFARNLDQWLKQMMEFVLEQARLYEKAKESTVRSQRIDTRIHLCLYFIAGANASASDLKVMQQLQCLLSIVPVLSRSEFTSATDLRECKERVLASCRQSAIALFDCGLAAPSKSSALTSSPLGPCPPFVFLTNCCDSAEASDFALLGKLVIGHFLLPSRAAAKALLRRYKAQQAQRRQETERLKRLATVSFLSAAAFGLVALLRK